MSEIGCVILKKNYPMTIIWNTNHDVDSLIQLKNTPMKAVYCLSIGITCSVTVILKLLLKETWKFKLKWDEWTEPNDILEKFQQIHFLGLCQIRRSLSGGLPINSDNSTTHVFCDTSQLSYASCIFVRTEVGDIRLYTTTRS